MPPPAILSLKSLNLNRFPLTIYQLTATLTIATITGRRRVSWPMMGSEHSSAIPAAGDAGDADDASDASDSNDLGDCDREGNAVTAGGDFTNRGTLFELLVVAWGCMALSQKNASATLWPCFLDRLNLLHFAIIKLSS